MSSQPPRRSGRPNVPQKRGRTESTSSAHPAPPRLSSLPDRLFLPSTPVTPRFSRDPPLVEVFFRRVQVRVEDDFKVSFDEDEILEEDQILLADAVSSQKPELTGSHVRDRVIFRSSGWIGEGQTKLVRYVGSLLITAHFTIDILPSAA